MDELEPRIRVVRGGRLGATPLRKGVYVLPNLITTAGLLSGFYSIVASFRGDFAIAAVAVVAANVFDALDGRVARITRTTSHFGIEYDSLSDLIAFGVAPGVLLYRFALEPWGTWGWLAASLYVTCGALRLARFNVQHDTAVKRHFVGLPIPAAAEMIASTVLLYTYLIGGRVTDRHFAALLIAYTLAGLMVSSVSYFSFKEFDIHRRQPFWVLVAVIVLLKLFVAEPQIFLFLAFFGYVASGPSRWIFVNTRRALSRRRRSRANADSPGRAL